MLLSGQSPQGPGPGFFDDDDEAGLLVEAALLPIGAAVDALADAWALAQPAGIEDVSALLGHSTVRVTQDLCIASGDLYTRFYTATA